MVKHMVASKNAALPKGIRLTPGEVRALAYELLDWSDRIAAQPILFDGSSQDDRDEVVVKLAEGMQQARRCRRQRFPELSTTEPLWDVMLELLIKELLGFRVTLGFLLRDCDMPDEIVCSCVERLVQAELIEANPARGGNWQVQLALSHSGRDRMTEVILESTQVARPIYHDRPSPTVAPK